LTDIAFFYRKYLLIEDELEKLQDVGKVIVEKANGARGQRPQSKLTLYLYDIGQFNSFLMV
jgi:hypothetical protein